MDNNDYVLKKYNKIEITQIKNKNYNKLKQKSSEINTKKANV